MPGEIAAITGGYLYAVVVGHFLTGLIVNQAWKRFLGAGDEAISEVRGDVLFGQVAGVLERALYTASWQVGQPEFIVFWLGIKVAVQWRAWTEPMQAGGREIHPRITYTIFLIGSGLDIVHGTIGAFIIRGFLQGDWRFAFVLPGAVIAACLLLFVWIRFTPVPKS